MGTYISNAIDAYREQTVKLFSMANPNNLGIQIVSSQELNQFAKSKQKGLKTKDGLGEVVDHENDVALLYNTGGLFADCCLEASVLNTTLNPIYSLANIIPVRPSNLEKLRFAFLTSITDPDDTYPDYPCDPPPQVGDIDGAFAEFYPGRISYRTKTMELDALISKACKGISEDLYLVGSVRGVSAFPTQEQLSDRNFISRAAVRRQIMLIGRAFQRDLLKQLWSGDPTNMTLNTAHGGRKEFYGLNYYIADDYDDKDFVEGTNLTSLNSDVKDYESNIIGGEVSLYNYLQTLEDTIFQRASMNGLLPVQWVWVMHPHIWSEIVKHLPCEMLTDSCGYSNVQFTVNADNGMGIQSIRQQMQNSMQISVNGRTHPVILDHSIPATQNVAGETPLYTSSIYFVPLNVAGEEVLYWTYRDYSLFDEVLAPIPGSADVGLRGWTDSGRYHFLVERSRRCFEVEAKAEFGLVFKAPWLAGRIDNVVANPLQQKPNWTTLPTTA